MDSPNKKDSKRREPSPSPSSASKLSTVSKLSGIVKLTGFKKKNKKKQRVKDSTEDDDKRMKNKTNHNNNSNNDGKRKKESFSGSPDNNKDDDDFGDNVDDDSLIKPDDDDRKKSLSQVPAVAETVSRSPTANTVTTEAASRVNNGAEQPKTSSVDCAPTTINLTSSTDKSATLERRINLSPSNPSANNEKKKQSTTLNSKKLLDEKFGAVTADRINNSGGRFKLFGKKKVYSKAVAVESTTLDMRYNMRNSNSSSSTNNSNDVTNGGPLSILADDQNEMKNDDTQVNWSIEATNQKVTHHLQSTEVYDSEDSELQTNDDRSNNDRIKRAPIVSRESSLTETESIKSIRTNENGNVHVIKKKSAGEIRQEILTRSAPRRISDIVSPTFQAKNNSLNRHTDSMQAKNNSISENRKELLCKILVIGELGTGKTSIIKRYVHQFFSQHYRATIGVDFALKVLAWDADTTIRLQLWDIAGQERFGNMTRVYYKEAHGAFIVFDVTRLATFEAVVKWKQDLDSKVQLTDGSPVPCVLLANKCDQQKEGIVNNHSKMEEYCKENKFISWFETSAKDNINIDQAASCLVTKILQNEEKKDNKDVNNTGVVSLENNNEQKKKSCSC